jgi:hypothetical protein
MTIQASQDPSLGFLPGDHVCAFYSGSRNVLDDIVVDYVTKGLAAGNRVFCMVDQPSAVQSRILPELVARDGMHVLRTHPRVYVNGILTGNQHYQADRLPG